MPSAPSVAWGKQPLPLKGGGQRVPGETEGAGLEAWFPHLLALLLSLLEIQSSLLPRDGLIPSAQRLVWAAKQALGKAALGALFA